MAKTLVPLPSQPDGISWPTHVWPTADLATTAGHAAAAAVTDTVDRLWTDTTMFGTTFATVVVHRGQLVSERYGGAIEHFDRDPEPVGPSSALLSWSMAKSMVHACVGMAVGDGLLDVDAPAPVPAWSAPGDPRAAITLGQLLDMRDGLAFAEVYDPTASPASDVVEMLFGSGKHDVAAYAMSRPAAHRPGTVFNYSSGTSNIVARILGDAVGDVTGDEGTNMRSWLHGRLFDAIGMTSATSRFDDAGTFIASSFVHATAVDFARFGLFALRDGIWDGERLLPAGWMDHARTRWSTDAVNGRHYGAHWWVADDAAGGFWASGYDGQFILCIPAADAVVVRLGRTPEVQYPALHRWRHDVTAAFGV
jgi:CubicO group peptidase (beta-lactamase class C family)